MQDSKRDIIVHPRFWHTVQALPVSQTARPPTRWDELPLAALHNIAGHCPTAQELSIFGRICKTARFVCQRAMHYTDLLISCTAQGSVADLAGCG